MMTWTNFKYFDLIVYIWLQEIGGVLRSLEDALAEAQRVNTKSQSAFDLKKKNLSGEENKRKELEKNMIEVSK